MARGFIVFGASGSGTTTTSKELARLLDLQHFDLDDYYWRWDTAVPFTVARPREERTEKLRGDLKHGRGFVLSGCLGEWGGPFIPMLDLAAFITAPTEVRIKRLKAREYARFGDRIRDGGDMFEQHHHFIDWAARYETMQPPQRCLALHQEWAASLPCRVLRIDGLRDPHENALRIAQFYLEK